MYMIAQFFRDVNNKEEKNMEIYQKVWYNLGKENEFGGCYGICEGFDR